jgi:hypothetical protein
MYVNKRNNWIRDRVCRSLDIGNDYFNTFLYDEYNYKLFESFLSGKYPENSTLYFTLIPNEEFTKGNEMNTINLI